MDKKKKCYTFLNVLSLVSVSNMHSSSCDLVIQFNLIFALLLITVTKQIKVK